MYNTYKNEILNRNGKKKPLKEVVREEHILSELEIIAKVEQAIKEKKMRLNVNINNSFMKDDENGSFNRDFEMLTHHRDKFKKSMKKDDSYPLDYQTYKKNFDTRKKEDTHLEKDSLSIKVDDSHLVPYNSNEDKNYQPKMNFPTIKNKNPSYDLKSHNSSNINPWIKYEYNHPGTYTEFIFKEKIISFNTSNFEVKEKREMAWSCCMNDKRESRGCQQTKINKQRWNLDSIP